MKRNWQVSCARHFSLREMFLFLVLVPGVAPYNAKGIQSIEAWERQALRATDPDVDAYGFRNGDEEAVTPHSKLVLADQQDIRSWESKALRATDPDLDTMGATQSDRMMRRKQQQILSGDINKLPRMPRSDTAKRGSRPRDSHADLATHPAAPKVKTPSRRAQQAGQADSAAQHVAVKPEKAASLPAQIQMVRKFLLSLQEQVHHDAKESARSLSQLRRVYRAAHGADLSRHLARSPTESPAQNGVSRALNARVHLRAFKH